MGIAEVGKGGVKGRVRSGRLFLGTGVGGWERGGRGGGGGGGAGGRFPD